MAWFVIGGVLYSAVIVAVTALIFFRKYDKLRMECFEKVIGKLHIEPPEEGEQAQIYLELYKGEGNISHKELIYLEVDRNSYVSQK